MSGFPSPSRSPIASPFGEFPVAKSDLETRDTVPPVLALRKTEIVLLLLFDTTISGFPSPSISEIAVAIGSVPVVESAFAAKLAALMTWLLANVTANG